MIALTACMGGEIPSLILQNRAQEARESALWYKKIFGDFYFEIQRNPIPELEKINRELIAMGRELDIPLVATNDVHYIYKEDAPTHDILLCIGTNSVVTDEKRMKMAGDFIYLKSRQEMAEALPGYSGGDRKYPEDRRHVRPQAGLHPPAPAGNRIAARQECPGVFKRPLLRRASKSIIPNPTPEIEQRLQYELEVIEKTQFANYFLVVWDMLSYARRQGILFGVRGSAAASIVLHCLGITAVDPIEHKLVFERFLNIERKEMPDIDSDFEDCRRQEVIDYVSNKYGADHVAQIITFGTLGARAAIRDVGRALGMPYGDVDRVARLIPSASA